MTHRLLIDEFAERLSPAVDDPGRVRGVLYRAKHFVLDKEASAFLRRLVEEAPDLIQELGEFALPPYDVIALTNLFDGSAWGARGAARETLTLWDHGEFKLVIRPAAEEQGIAPIPGWTKCPTGELSIENLHPAVNVKMSLSRSDSSDNTIKVNGEEADDEKLFCAIKGMMVTDNGQMASALWTHRLLIAAFFLVLSQPRSYVVNFSDGRRTVRRGHTVRFFARSEIKIDLSAPKKLIRMFRTAVRGSPRRHDVRRHFVHYRGDRNCVHEWMAIEGDDKRWECSCCGRLRVARGPFGRGDANKGFVHQSYAVTA